MRQELQSALMQARTLAPEELPRLLGDLEEIRASAMARLLSPAVESGPDEMLDIDQAAERMNLSKDYLYRHHKRFPFARRIGRKLLFSSAGLDSYLKRAR
jgi:excisionase family DNA binding protein